MDIQGETQSIDNAAYDSWAYYYDLDLVKEPNIDGKFYLNIVSQFEEILELCCGTGRITIFLAQNNIRVTALDISEQMLKILRKKIRANNNLAKRIRLVKANMINFNLGKKFDCVLIPFHSFLSLTSSISAKKTLKTIFSHLTDKGVLIFNVFKPIENMKDLEGEIEVRTVIDHHGMTYEKKCVNTFVDVKKQIISYTLEYYLLKDAGKICVVKEKLRSKFYYYPQIEKMLKEVKFEVIKVYTGFDENINNSHSSELTLICKKIRF